MRYPIRAELVKRETHDGLMGMHDVVEIGTGYRILGPAKIMRWKNLPTGRIIPRVSVRVLREDERWKPGAPEKWMPTELLKLSTPEQAVALLFDGNLLTRLDSRV